MLENLDVVEVPYLVIRVRVGVCCFSVRIIISLTQIFCQVGLTYSAASCFSNTVREGTWGEKNSFSFVVRSRLFSEISQHYLGERSD